MKNKTVISIIAIILAILMALSLVVSVLPTIANAEVTQEDIDELQAEKEALAKKSGSLQEEIKELKALESTALEQKRALAEQIEYAQEQIELTSEQIELYNQMIASKKAEVDAAKEVEEIQLEKYRSRIRAMEENGKIGVLGVILQSSSLSELLTAIDDIQLVMESDKLLEDQYIEAREKHEEKLGEFQKEKALYDAKKEELEEEEKALNTQIEETNAMLEELAAQIEEAEAAYEAALRAEAAAAASVSNLLQQYYAEQLAANIAAQGPVDNGTAGAETPAGETGSTEAGNTDTGTTTGGSTVATASSGFIWPVPGMPFGMRITSRYGNRYHPISGKYTFHTGIDIDGYNMQGSPVVASAGGVVAIAGYDGGYGNYVVIDHGGGIATLYAHLCSISVSKGQSVSQGQTVGGIGTTGSSTGVHCHFEVRVNGSTVDPLGYLPGGYYFYDC